MCNQPYTIYRDDLQEGYWFQGLDDRLSSAIVKDLPRSQSGISREGLFDILKYDRPDIVLKCGDDYLLVLERTSEVPSGHNVGQRYGRLVAGAEIRVPVLYFGPYAAYKHGGNTQGPRYMNLRLFYSLDNLEIEYDTAISTINWPVDSNYEVLRGPSKDTEVIEYVRELLDYYEAYGLDGLTTYMATSQLQSRLKEERDRFIEEEVVNPEQYDAPPESVIEYDSVSTFCADYSLPSSLIGRADKVYLYRVGMTYIRSDPYAGMSGLYKYLYCLEPDTLLILHFPHIFIDEWRRLRRTTKTYRMFKSFSDGIIFRDGFLRKADL